MDYRRTTLMADYILVICIWTTLGGLLWVGDFEWSTLHG